jgi:hypothetical protein
MSNEHHDVAALTESSGIGIDALHVPAPDEVLADVPFEMWDSRRESAPDVKVGRDELMNAITTQCFEGRPSLLEAGMRFCAMASRAGVPVPMNANERREMRAVIAACNGSLWLPRCDEAASVFEFLAGGITKPRYLGRRLSLMAYAFNRGAVILRVFPSMESIGHLWGLSADNKRSAVCAALVKLKKEILRGGWMTKHRRLNSFQFWFEKSEEAKANYAEAQMGNGNRLSRPCGKSEEVRELIHGIPVKAEFRRLKPHELRSRLDALAGILDRIHRIPEFTKLAEGES